MILIAIRVMQALLAREKVIFVSKSSRNNLSSALAWSVTG